jgi:hypothetical protein
MDREFFFKLVPQAQAFLQERVLLQKAVLLLDNAPSHPIHSILTSNDGLNVVKFLPQMSQHLFSPWTKK